MARKAREKSISGYYSVLIGGYGRLFIDDEDYENFIEKIDKYIGEEAKAFALIENAACLVVKESEKGIGADIKPLTTSYTRYFQKRYDSDEKLFERRFASEPIETAGEMAHALAMIHRMCSLAGKDGFTGRYSADELYIPDDAVTFMGGMRDYKRELENISELDGIFMTLINKRRSVKAENSNKTVQRKPEKENGKAQAEKPVKEKSRPSKKMPAWLL